jgi:transposase-like protein
MNFQEYKKKFPTKQAVINHFIKIRYKNGIVCNHCGCKEDVYKMKKTPKKFICHSCNNTFSIFKDTIFEKSSTDLKKWFYAIHLFLNGKKGISALQLQREIGTTYKTAWRMLQQIRKAMGNKKKDDDDDYMTGIIEIDETYVGGKSENKHMSKRIAAKGIFQKSVILGMLSRNKEVRAFKIDNAKTNTIYPYILENVAENSQIITDEHKAYYWLQARYKHQSVNHSKGEYKKGDNFHTNSLEGFWATMKRGVYGIYHHISSKYTQNYVNEFCFRYNNRGNKKMFDLVLAQAVL